MNINQATLDAYRACIATIRAKLDRLQQLATDHFSYNPDAFH